jgi:Cu/Ag efflux pump CusA
LGGGRVANERIAARSRKHQPKNDADIGQIPRGKQTLAQVGRTNDGTDPKGFFDVQIQVDLKNKKDWPSGVSGDDLIDQMDAQLTKIPARYLTTRSLSVITWKKPWPV